MWASISLGTDHFQKKKKKEAVPRVAAFKTEDNTPVGPTGRHSTPGDSHQ